MTQPEFLLKTKLEKFRLILGSASPRRQQLLAGLDLEFVVSSIGADESFDASIDIEQVPEVLAKRKSLAFNDLNSDQLLITADTVVIFQGEIINKPGNHEEAVEMLQKLSGNAHRVITGVCIRSAHKQIEFSESSTVYFAPLNKGEIEYYVHKYPPFDKAGGYGIQDWIGYIGIQKIEGCFYNVMGLPVHQLYKTLCEF